FDEVLAASSTAELLAGLYELALPALDRAMAEYAADTNPLCDAPSLRVLRFARLEVADMIDYGTKSIACLVDEPAREAMRPWLAMLEKCLEAAGGPGGKGPKSDPSARMRSAMPYVYDRKPKRDERFTDSWNQGVSPEAFLYDESYDARSKVLMMLFK